MPSPSASTDRLAALRERRNAPAGGWVPEQPASVTEVLATARWNPGRRGVLVLAVVGLVAAVLATVVLVRARPSSQPLAVPPAVGGATTAATGGQLVVDVAGKVRRPGLVSLAAGARVDDALRAAGGVLPGVRTDALNLARKLADGEQVLVGVAAAAAGAGASGLLNLNTATATDIEKLPGIGPVLAQKIVDWRTEHSRFASVDQLREVSGIGESKFAGLRTKVTV